MSTLHPELDEHARPAPDPGGSNGQHTVPAAHGAPITPASMQKGSGPRQAAHILVFLVSVAIVVVGIGVGGFGVLVSLLDASSEQVMGTTVSAAVVALTGGLGLSLAWQSLQAMLRRASRPFRPKGVGLWLLLFLVAVASGQMVLSLDLLPAILMPPFHIAAAIMPALLILGAVGRSLGGVVRWRGIVLQLSSGAFVSTILAFTLEIAVVVVVMVLILVVVGLQPGGFEQIQVLADRLGDPAWLQDEAVLGSLASSPLVVIVVFFFFSLVIPLIEESVKTVGVGLLSYRHPSLAQSFLWGLACGTGFAIAEGLFNSIGGLDVWAVVVTVRVGATLLHSVTGALMGLAWYYVLQEKRWAPGVGLFVGSVGLHGLWNALAAGISLISLGTLDSDLPSVAPGGASLGIMALIALLALLAGLVSVGLAALTRFVRNRSPGLSPDQPWRGTT